MKELRPRIQKRNKTRTPDVLLPTRYYRWAQADLVGDHVKLRIRRSANQCRAEMRAPLLTVADPQPSFDFDEHGDYPGNPGEAVAVFLPGILASFGRVLPCHQPRRGVSADGEQWMSRPPFSSGPHPPESHASKV